jgi:hypothetical protein
MQIHPDDDNGFDSFDEMNRRKSIIVTTVFFVLVIAVTAWLIY